MIIEYFRSRTASWLSYFLRVLLGLAGLVTIVFFLSMPIVGVVDGGLEGMTAFYWVIAIACILMGTAIGVLCIYIAVKGLDTILEDSA